MDSIEHRLRGAIVQALKRPAEPSQIKGDDLIHELGITSVDALELLITVENEFGIHIDDSDLSQKLVSSLDNLEAYVRQRLSDEHAV